MNNAGDTTRFLKRACLAALLWMTLGGAPALVIHSLDGEKATARPVRAIISRVERTLEPACRIENGAAGLGFRETVASGQLIAREGSSLLSRYRHDFILIRKLVSFDFARTLARLYEQAQAEKNYPVEGNPAQPDSTFLTLPASISTLIP